MNISVNGHDCFFYTAGKVLDANKPTVLFLHGAQSDHSVWLLQTRWFANHGFNVIAPDLPGHGRSAGQVLNSVEDMATWARALLHALKIEKAHWVGHSMGSLVALDAAARFSHTVRSLSLLGNATPMPVGPALLEAAQKDPLRAIDMMCVWSHAGYSSKPQAPGPGAFLVWGTRRLMQHINSRNGTHVLFNDLNACNQYSHGVERITQVQCPTVFICGKQDMMTSPKGSQALAATMSAAAGAKVVQIDQCGHMMMGEQPDATLDALIKHIARAG